MFTVWICIECLHRILKSELLWTKWPLSLCPQHKLRREVSKKKKNLCQNNVWTNVFNPWLCDGRVLFLHLFLKVIFYIFHQNGDVNVLSWDSSVVFFLMSLVYVLLMSKAAWWVISPQRSWPSCCYNTMLYNITGKVDQGVFLRTSQ